jgi:hypothetical protein
MSVGVGGCQGQGLFQSASTSPMCAREEVVQFVVKDLQRHEPYSELLPQSIGEQPTADPAVVFCTATVVKKDYDYTRYWSQAWQGYQEYSVRNMNAIYEVTMRPRVLPVSP